MTNKKLRKQKLSAESLYRYTIHNIWIWPFGSRSISIKWKVIITNQYYLSQRVEKVKPGFRLNVIFNVFFLTVKLKIAIRARTMNQNYILTKKTPKNASWLNYCFSLCSKTANHWSDIRRWRTIRKTIYIFYLLLS